MSACRSALGSSLSLPSLSSGVGGTEVPLSCKSQPLLPGGSLISLPTFILSSRPLHASLVQLDVEEEPA